MPQPLPSKADVVVIGAGLIGASIAWQTAQLGVNSLVVLERGEIGAQGASSRSLGGWRDIYGTEINVLFSHLSKPTLDSLADETGIDPLWDNCGYLFTASGEVGWEALKHTTAVNQKLGLSAVLISPEEIAQRWPYLRTADLKGGIWSPSGGVYGPIEVLQAYARGARRLGVKFYENTEVTGIAVTDGRATEVVTSRGKIKADYIINACGPWARPTAAMAGLELPIDPLRRHLFHTGALPFDDIPMKIPFTLHYDSGWYTRREGQGLILSGPADSSPEARTFNQKVDFAAEEWSAARSMERIPLMERAGIARGWVGHYALTPDHHHVMGEFPEVKGLYHASGFSGHGFQQSPLAGLAVAEWIVKGRTECIDLDCLSPTRFREGKQIHEQMITFRDDETMPLGSADI